MASKMVSLCREGIDGLFVTIPSDAVIDAIKECQALNVPIMSVNTGAQAALDLGLIHHVSQLEYSAGFGAGKRLAEAGIVEGMCLNNAAGNSALEERCQGMEDALKEEGISYLGMVMVPRDYVAAFVQNVEDAVDRPQDDDWEGIGVLVLSQGLVSDMLVVKEKHPKLIAASFDASNEIYDAIGDGEILFGIDQNPFVQGYMPLWLLATFAHTKQHLRNIFIETGPSFVDESPSEALQACIANDFEVCPRPINRDMNQLTRIRPVGLTFAALALAASIFFAGWVVWNRKKTVVRKR
jgi:simple sugar transport system substrate-binding protein